MKISLKRMTALATVIFHLVTFATPKAAGWVVTDPQGNIMSSGDGSNTQVNAAAGGRYHVTDGDIAEGQSVHVNVLNADGLVDPTASAIFEFFDNHASVWAGTLTVDGIAAFINTLGFDITASFQGAVNGGAILSTLGIDSASFFAGIAEFSRGFNQDTAFISNKGNFKLGEDSFLALISSAVQNEGNIAANGGPVVLAAGDRVTLDISGGKGIISVAIDEPVSAPVVDLNGNRIESAINNSGTVQNAGGLVIFSARAAEQVFDSLVNHTGIVEANSIASRNGQIILDGGDQGIVSVTGTLRAKGDDYGETGGKIHVLGEKAGLFEGATVDASGYNGGGEVLIGGDYQGLGSVPNAKLTHVDKWADVNADAIMEGDGGKIIVWGDDAMSAHGTFSIRGGLLSGDGGLLETSSHGYFNVSGIGVDARAEAGSTGTWLLDPATLTINGGTSDGNDNGVSTTLFGNNGAGDNGTITYANAAPSSIFESEIEGTDANLQLQATNGIGVSGAFTGGLTIKNNRDIKIETRNSSGEGSTGIDLVTGATGFSITTSGSGNVTINSGTNGGDAGSAPINLSTITTGSGSITVNAEGTLTINGVLNTGDLAASGTTGAISLTSQTAGVVVNNTVNTGNSTVADAASGQTAQSGAITVSAGTSITGTGSLTTGNAELTGAAASGTDKAVSGDITLTAGTTLGLSNAAGAVNVGSAQRTGSGAATDTVTTGNLTLNSGTEINNGTASTALKLAIAAASGGATTNLGTLIATTTAASGNIFASNTGLNVLNLGALTTSGGSVNVTSANGLNLTGTVRTDQGTNAGAVTLTGPVTLGANTTIDTDATTTDAAVTFAGTVNSDSTARDLILRAGTANIDFQGAVGASSGLSNLTVTSGNQTTFSNTVRAENVDIISTTARFTDDVTATLSDIKVTGNAVLLGDVDFTTGLGSGDDFSVSGTLAASGGLRNVSVTAGSGSVDFGSTVTTSGGNFSSQGSGFDNTGATITTSGGGITINHTSGLTIAAALNSGAGDIEIDGASNVIINAGLTTSGGAITLSAKTDVSLAAALSDITTGGGNYTVTADSDANGSGDYLQTNAGSAVNTGGGDVSITADNFDLVGTHNAGSGAASLLLSSAGTSLRLGSGGSALNADISGTELQTITANSLTVGGSNASTVSVRGITAANSNNIGTVNVNAMSAAGTVTFDTTASTFNALGANAGNGITLNQNVTTDTGGIAVNADSDASGTGTFTIATGVTANTSGQDMSITANDFVLTGTAAINAGAAIVSLLTSKAGTTVGVGGGAGTFNVSDAEADKITASELSIGANDSGNMNVDVISPANADTLTLKTGGTITEGAAGIITVDNLQFEAGGAVTLDQDANVFDTISGTTTSGAVNVKDSGTNTEIKDLKTVGSTVTYEHTGLGDVTVTGTVSSGNGVTNGGDILITSSNDLTISNPSAEINTTAGTGGALNASGATFNFGDIVLGAGNITLNGSGLDTVISGAIMQAAEYVISALRNIVVENIVTTTNAGAQINLTSDSDLDGAGGVWVKSTGGLDSAGDITLTASEYIDMGTNLGAGVSIQIDAGATLTADGNIALQDTGAGITPAGTDMLINGTVTSSGAGATLTVDTIGSLTTSDDGAANLTADNLDLTAGGDIDVEVDGDGIVLETTTGNISVEDMLDGLTLNGLTNPGTGTLTILTHSPLVIAADIIQAATINLTASESVDVDDHVTVNAGVTVQATGAGSDVNITAGDDVNLNGTLVKSDTDAVTITAGSGDTDDIGSVNLAGDVEAATTLTLNALTTGGTLGLIAQTAGAVSAVDLILNADDSADLNQAGNSVTALDATTGGTVTYQDADGLDLKASTIGGAFSVTTGGNLTDSGTLAVTGTTTLIAGANDITLDETASDFSTVSIVSANNASITDTDGLDLGASTVTGDLKVISDALTDSGTVTADTLEFNAGGTVTLDEAGNDFNDIAGISNGSMIITDTDDLEVTTVGGTSGLNPGVTNDITINTGDILTLSQNVTANGGGGTVTLNTAAGGVNQTGGVLDINELLLLGTGTYTLEQTGNDIDRLAADVTGDINFKETLNAVTIDSINGTDGVKTNGGNFNLDAATDVTINDQINAGAGDVDIDAGGTVTSTDDSTADIVGATIDITAASIGGSAVDVTATTAINADTSAAGGKIEIDSIGDAKVGLINAGAGDVTLDSTGAIDSVNNDDTADVNGATVNLIAAAGGIGSNNNLEFTATIAVNADTTVDNGTISLDSIGDAKIGLIDAGSGEATLNSTTAIDSVTNDGAADVNGATVNLIALVGGIGQNSAVDFTATTAINANTTADNSSISLDSIGDAKVGTLTTGSTTAGTVNLHSTGAIDSVTDDGFADIAAKTINLAALAGGIGQSSVLDFTAGGATMNADTTADGSAISLDSIGNAVVGLITTGGAGNITLDSTGSITEDSDAAADFVGNVLTLDTAGQIDVDTTVASLDASTSAAGDILIDETDAINLLDVDTTDGTITVNADNGDLTATDVVAGTSGNVNLTTITSGDVLLGTVTAAGNTVTVDSADEINGINSANITTGDTLDLDAINGIGNVEPLKTASSSISADTTDGNIDINNDLATAVEATSLTTGTGTINFDQTGSGDLTVTSAATSDGTITVTVDDGSLTATSVVAGGTGDVSLTTTTTGDILVETVTAGGNTVTANSIGSINGVSGANITTADTIDLDAVTGIGDTTALNTAATTISADTTDGNMDINNALATAVTAASLTTGTGTINFDQTGSGDLTVTSASTTVLGDIQVTVDDGDLNAVSITTFDGDIDLITTTSGDVNVDEVAACGACNDITIDSAGAIEELGTDGTEDLFAFTMSLKAVNGIGNFGTIEIDATTLTSAEVTAAGVIDLNDLASGLAVTSTTTFDGGITINADSGNLDATTVTAGGGGDIDLSTTTSGDVNVDNVTAVGNDINVTSAGAIEELNADADADLTSDTLTLSAVTGIGTADTLEIDATTLTSADVSGTGIIDLNDIAGGLDVTSATTADGTITINADGGTLNATTVTADGVGADVNLSTTTSGDVNVDNVTATDDTVTVTSADAIDELNNDGGADITAGTIDLTANNGGIGTGANPLDVTATVRVDADTTAANGDIFFDSIGDFPIGVIDAGAGDATLTSTGNMTDADLDQLSNINAATINLTTTGGDIGVAGSLENYLDIQPTTLWNAATAGGDLHVNCLGTCPTGLIDLGTGNGDLSVGTLVDGNDDLFGEFNSATVNLIAGGFEIVSTDGIGSATDAIEMQLHDFGGIAGDGRFIADGGTGGIFAANTGTTGFGLTLDTLPAGLLSSVTADGDIVIVSGSPLTVNVNVGSGSDITLAALGAANADDLTVNSGITIASGGAGNVLLAAGDRILLDNNAVVGTTGAGTVTAAAGEDYTDFTLDQDGNVNGDVRMNNNSAFVSEDGDILVDAARNSRLETVNANSDGDGVRGDVIVRARTGAISDRNGATVNITGDHLTLEAVTGIGDGAVLDGSVLETNVVTLNLTNTTSGDANVTEVSAGGALDIENAVQDAATGLLNILTTNGHLTVLAAGSGGSGVSAKAGEMLLQANGGGSNDDLRVNNTVTSTTGKINLDSTSRDVIFSAAGDVTATGGAEIEVSASRDLTMADGTILQANGGGAQGGIDLDAGRDITFGSVQTTSTLSTNLNADAFDAVAIDAGRGVIDGGDTDHDIIAQSGQTTINAVRGIGNADQLDVQLLALKATNTTANDIRVREMAAGGDLDLIQIDQLASGGQVNIRTQNGTLTVLAAADGGAGVAAVDGATRLFAQDSDASGADHLVINNNVVTDDGKINLDSENDVQFSVAGDVTSTTGEIEVEALDNVTMTDSGVDGTILNAGSGRIDIDAGSDITLTSVQTTSTLADAVTLVSRGGQIIDGGDTDTDVVTGALTGGLILSANSGIGSADGLETQIGQLAAVTDTGNIQIFNTGALTIADLTDPDALTGFGFAGAGTVSGVTIQDTADLNPSDFIFITAASPMTVNSAITDNAGGDITLASLGALAADDMTLNANVGTNGGSGNILITAGDTISISAGVTVSADSTGNITLTAGEDFTDAVLDQDGNTGASGGDVTMADTSKAVTGSGTILADAADDVNIASLQTGSNAGNAVTVIARAGAVTDAGDTDTDVITGAAGTLTIDVVEGVGSGNALETTVGFIDVDNTASGNVQIDEIDSAQGDLGIFKVAQTGPGDVIVRTEDGTLTVVAAGSGGSGVSATSGETTLFARDADVSGADHLVVNNTVTSTSGKVNLDSANDVQFSVEGDVTTTSGEIEVDATDFLTMADNGADSTILDAGSAHIDLDAGQDVTLASVKTTSTDNDAVVIVSRDGAIIDGGDTDGFNVRTGALAEDPSVFDGGLLLSAATGIGRRADALGGLETKTGRLAAINDAGDIQVFNTGALNITTLTDPDAATSLGFAGAGTVTGISVLSFAGAIIFVTAASPMLISSAVTNLAGGDISLYALGGALTDTMTVSANVESSNGNGDIRMVSGSDMTMDPGTVISTEGDGVTSGTGQIFIGAGYDATGKAANESVAPGINLTDPSASLLDTPGNTAANLTMDETSRIWTEDGDILVDAQNTFTAGRVDADGNAGAGITDGIRGDITIFSRNGATLDAEAANVGNLDFVANVLTMFSGGTIGLVNNPIEFDAPFFNATATGSIFATVVSSTLLEATSTTGSVLISGLSDLLLGHAFAPTGDVALDANGSILSQGGADTRIIANDAIRLSAGNVIGTADNAINVQLNNPGTLSLAANGSMNGLSTNVRGNFSPLSVNFNNTPPGLALVNGIAVGGQLLSAFTTSLSGVVTTVLPLMLAQFGQFDGRYAADFPGIFNMAGFGTPTPTSIDTTGLDVIELPEQLPPPVVPIPAPAVPAPTPEPVAETKPAAELPAGEPAAKQPELPQDEEETPPAVVPIPPAPQSALGGPISDQAAGSNTTVSGTERNTGSQP